MKKTQIFISTILIVGALTAAAMMQQEKPLTVSANVQQWQLILTVVDQSNAPHTQVMEVQKFLIGQLDPQIKAAQAKADSLKNKK